MEPFGAQVQKLSDIRDQGFCFGENDVLLNRISGSEKKPEQQLRFFITAKRLLKRISLLHQRCESWHRLSDYAHTDQTVHDRYYWQ